VQAPARDDGAALERLMQSVGGISQRLERLEGDIRTQVRSGSDVHDVAEQVSQLAHVVELLAGAVGETGQVKRLEAQIAGLGDMLANAMGENGQSKRIEGQIASLGRIISQGREIDSSALTRRIDDIASTIGRLAELQVHYVDKVENPVAGQAFRDGMRSIEDSVRAIYDRIDGLERNATVKPEDLEQISAQMARFTEAMGASGTAPHSLVELIDELNTRIADIESGDRLLPQLRKDLAVLRDAVVFSLGPRFDAIETRMDGLSTRDDVAELGRQVGLLSERVNQRQADGGIGQLEAQVRQLVARMDQTGEQLAGLARMTSDGAGLVMPDLSAMADMVAERTAAAIGKSDSSALSETISGLERRISAMLETMPRDPITGDLSEVQAGVGEVNQRLKRLEETLLNRAASAEPIAPATRTDIASIIAASEPMPR
jgi:localization factor PodJL